MKRTLTLLAGLVAVLSLFLTLSAAGVAAGRSNSSVATAARAATLTAHSSRYGKILFDSRGRVLYLFARDRGGHSKCYGACAAAWPPFLTNGPPKGLRGVNPKLLGTTKRTDGTLQVTYAKQPLYYFKEDTKPGQIKCQNVSNFGGLWLVVSPAGKAIH